MCEKFVEASYLLQSQVGNINENYIEYLNQTSFN